MTAKSKHIATINGKLNRLNDFLQAVFFSEQMLSKDNIIVEYKVLTNFDILGRRLLGFISNLEITKMREMAG